MPESQLRQLLQRKNPSLVSTQVLWLLPDFEFKVSLEQSQTWKLSAALNPPRVSLPTCLVTPSGVWGTPGALNTPFSDMAQHSPLSSTLLPWRGCSCIPSTAHVPSQTPTNTHNYFNRTLRHRQENPFWKAHLPENSIVKTREIGSMLSCSTWALCLPPSHCYYWPLAGRSKD